MVLDVSTRTAVRCRGMTAAGRQCENPTLNGVCGLCKGTSPASTLTTVGQVRSLADQARVLAADDGINDEAEALLKGLNPEQREAVTHEGGALVVVAGAGSGKTGVLTRRAAWLVEAEGVAPEEIMAVTFTNKAAEEMRLRVGKLVGDEAAERMTIGTFHATCAELLRSEHETLGYPEDFSVYDTEDTEAMLSGVLRSLGVDRRTLTVGQARAFISDAKSHLRAPGEGLDADDPASTAAHDAYREYERRLRLSKAMDFDDLVGRTVKLLREDPEARARCRQRSRHLLLDEYQDTNPAQTALVRLLAGDDQQVFAVGDPDQSIYGFRAASAANLVGFAETFPGARTLVLHRNYRSTQTILDAANAVIAPNSGRPPRALVSELGEGERIVLYEGSDEVQEAGWVAQRIAGLRGEAGGEDEETAILVRTNAATRPFAERLAAAGIPYVVKDGSSLVDSKEARAVVAHLRIVTNPEDDVAYQRALVSAKGVGDTSVLKLRAWAEANETTLDGAARHAEAAGLATASRKAVERFLETHDDLVARSRAGGEGATPSALLDRLDEATEFSARLSGDKATAVQNLRNIAGGHTDVASYLERVALEAADDAPPPKGFVTIATIHASKGLEWDNVFVAGMEEGVMPSGGDDDPEEERRLAYVAMTRAGRRLFLTSAASRAAQGIPAFNPTSRFVRDIPPHLVTENSDPLAVVPLSAPTRAPAATGGRGPVVPFPTSPTGTVGEVVGQRADGRLVLSMPAADPEIVADLALSPTAIDNHSRCPAALFYNSVARLPKQSSPAARIGTHFHAIVERLHALPPEERTRPAAEKIADEVEAEWRAKEHYNDFTDEHYAEARGLLDGYFEIEDPARVRPVAMEQKIRTTLDDGTVISGVIDRLERDEDGTLVVTDYKTGAQPRGRQAPWAHHQAHLYAALVRRTTGETPAKLRIIYPRGGDKGPPAIIEAPITEADIAHIEHLASRAGREVRESLATGKFVACPGGQCRRCDFKDSCPASSAASAAALAG